MKYFKLFCAISRTWPLYFVFIIKIKLMHDEYALRWLKDVERLGESRFFYVLAARPYYRDWFYHRFHLPSFICLPIFGGEGIAIPRIDIGEGVFLEHPHGSHLNAKQVGKNFKCLHNVTLGVNHDGVPTIGDNVFCGVGCCVLGGIRIGNNVKIGANAVIVKDVPDNCVVVGNPSLIVKRNGIKCRIPL